MRIAYVGSAQGTSLHRARALGRLGHEVTIIDPWAWLGSSNIRRRLHFHSGYIGAGFLINRRLFSELNAAEPDLIWVNQGEFLGPEAVTGMRAFGVPLVNYANDNPFSMENRRRFRLYRRALSLYDLVVTVFAQAVEPAKRCGAKKVIRKYISADEVAHCPRPLDEELRRKYRSEVAFVGTWMKGERGPFIAGLIKRGVPVSVWGDRWHRSRDWETIAPHWRGPGVYDEDSYAAILQSAKICLGLVNERSGNLHTDRSLQIPAIGSLLCAKRTSEHLALYREGEEAVFWSDIDECAERCRVLLADDGLRRKIAQRGHERALRNHLFNEAVMAAILAELAQ